MTDQERLDMFAAAAMAGMMAHGQWPMHGAFEAYRAADAMLRERALCPKDAAYTDGVSAGGETKNHGEPPSPTDVLEHMVAFRTLRRNIRCWVRVERPRWSDANALTEDYEQMYRWVLEHKMNLDAMSAADAARFIAQQWPLCNAVEVLEGSTLCGCVYYPEWP